MRVQLSCEREDGGAVGGFGVSGITVIMECLTDLVFGVRISCGCVFDIFLAVQGFLVVEKGIHSDRKKKLEGSETFVDIWQDFFRGLG
jgi:hypothetical protein